MIPVRKACRYQRLFRLFFWCSDWGWLSYSFFCVQCRMTIYDVIYAGLDLKIFENFEKRHIYWSSYILVDPCRGGPGARQTLFEPLLLSKYRIDCLGDCSWPQGCLKCLLGILAPCYNTLNTSGMVWMGFWGRSRKLISGGVGAGLLQFCYYPEYQVVRTLILPVLVLSRGQC